MAERRPNFVIFLTGDQTTGARVPCPASPLRSA